jgi:hypothetical protein
MPLSEIEIIENAMLHMNRYIRTSIAKLCPYENIVRVEINEAPVLITKIRMTT